MSPSKGFRVWFNRLSFFGLFNPPSEDTYNEPLFESQVKRAVRYRQVQPRSLSPTDYLSEAEPQLPSKRLPQSPAQESSPEQIGLTPLDHDKNPNLQNGDKGASANALVASSFMANSLIENESTPTVVKLFLDQTKGYIRQGLWDKAIAACKKAIAIDPQQAEAHRLMGKTLQSMGQPFDAMEYYADALILQPQSVDTYTDLGDLYSRRQEWEQAITYYQTAIDLAANIDVSKSREVLRAAQDGLMFAQAQVQRQVNRANQTVDNLYHSLSLSPETFTAEEHCEMGRLLIQQGDSNNAMECFQRAIDCQPACVDAHLQLAILLEQRQRWQESMFHYKQVVQATQSLSDSSSPEIGTTSGQANGVQKALLADSSLLANTESSEIGINSRSAIEDQKAPIAHSSVSANTGPLGIEGETEEGEFQTSPQDEHITPNALDHAEQALDSVPLERPSDLKPAGPTPLPHLTTHRDESDPLVASIQAFVALARNYGEHGDMDKAIAHYRNALSLDPKNHDIHQELTSVLAQQHSQKLDE